MLAGRVMERILVVGAGLTGASTAALLRKEIPKDNLDIVIWDKSRGAGGRMSTSRSPGSQAASVDLGAQYISAKAQDLAAHQSYYKDLEAAGVLKPMTGVIENEPGVYSDCAQRFVMPGGSSTIVKYFLQQARCLEAYEQHISSIVRADGQWEVQTKDGHNDRFDAVVLTMPVPQILQFQGDIKDIIDSKPDVKEKLQKVSYSSRFAVGLFYEPGTKIDVPWAVKYFKGDPCIAFISIDNKKRGQEESKSGPSVVIHTSVPFGLQHLEVDMDTVCPEMVLPAARKLVPELPDPKHVKNLKWRFSQVYKPYEGTPGAVVLNESPLLLCTGDSFYGSGFDNCLKAARIATDVIKRSRKPSPDQNRREASL